MTECTDLNIFYMAGLIFCQDGQDSEKHRIERILLNRENTVNHEIHKKMYRENFVSFLNSTAPYMKMILPPLKKGARGGFFRWIASSVGALFIAIEKNPANGFSYEKASLDKTGCIMLNGEKINDLNMLVQQCLAGL